MEEVVSMGGGGEMRAVYVEVHVREGVYQGCGNVEGVVCGHERRRRRLGFVSQGEPGFASNVAYIRRSASHPG